MVNISMRVETIKSIRLYNICMTHESNSKNNRTPCASRDQIAGESYVWKSKRGTHNKHTIIKHCVDAYNTYVSYNGNDIDNITHIDDRYCITNVKGIMTHCNYCQCGVKIRSMCKQIMNEYMCLAEELNLSMYYQDTGSMHIKYEDVDTLAN